MLRSIAGRAMRKSKSLWLTARIEAKWRRDSRSLPLTPAHRELYEIIHRLCWRELDDFPDLIKCRDFNDRIQWLKLFDQDREIIRCSDKITVRDYVRERVGEQHLVNVYQIHDHFSQINFDSLPNAFVIKTNHDSGTVILVRDKSLLNKDEAEEKVEKSLRTVYGWLNGEWAYSFIQPKVFVEELLIANGMLRPADYKFHCVDGSVRWLQYIYDRGYVTKEVNVSADGHVIDVHFGHNMTHFVEFTVPDNWDHMIDIVESLAYGFRYVRVDVYCLGGRVYVGEMTFFPLMGCYKGEGQKELGKLLDFERSTHKPFLLNKL